MAKKKTIKTPEAAVQEPTVAQRFHQQIIKQPTPEMPIFKTTDKGTLKEIQKTNDGFANFAAKLGANNTGPWGSGQGQNLLSQGFYIFNLMTRNRIQLEAAYRGSWIVGQVIDTFAEDMTRSGIEINTNEGAEELQELQTYMSRIKIWDSIADTIKWGRLYGGALGILQLKGQKLDSPLDLDTVMKGQFQGIGVYDRWQVYPVVTEVIDSGPDIGLPKYYDIVLGANLNDPGQEPGGQETKQASGRVRVHHSRCIRMIGHKLPFWQAITEMMWGESVLERMWDRLIAFDDATMSAGNLISRAQLRTVGVDGLREILAVGGEAQEALISQFEYMRELQNNEGITLLDKEDTFSSTAYTFAGLSDVLIQFGQQVSGSAQIPLVRLFGQSPAGMNSTGESDIRLYYDSINAKQEATLRVPFEMILKVCWRSLFGESLPDDLTFEFTPLWQMTAKDKADIAKINTDTIVEAFESGLQDKPTAMKELKQSSDTHGIFSNISDEAITEAENEPAPLPESEAPPLPKEATGNKGGTIGEPGEGPAVPKSHPESKATTSGDAMEVIDFVRKVGEKWVVFSEAGKHLGEYKTEAEARKRLQQIEYFKSTKDSRQPWEKIKQWVKDNA